MKINKDNNMIFMYLLGKEDKTKDEKEWFDKYMKVIAAPKCVCA